MSVIAEVSYGILWLAVIAIGILVLLLYRHFGLAALGTLDGVQRDGVRIGELVPQLTGITAENQPFVWEPAAFPSLLLFATPGCEPCSRILPIVDHLGSTLPDLNITVVVSGTAKTAKELVQKFHLKIACVADDGSNTKSAFRVRVSPFAFVVGPDRRVRSKGLCSDALRLRDILTQGGLNSAADRVDRIGLKRTTKALSMIAEPEVING